VFRVHHFEWGFTYTSLYMQLDILILVETELIVSAD